MKKISLLLLGALGFAAVSCDDAPPVPAPQQNPEQPLYSGAQVSIAKDGALATSDVVALESYRESEEVPVLKVTEAQNLPEGTSLAFTLRISKSQAMTDMDSIPVTVTDGIGYADAKVWNADHLAFFGQQPTPFTVYYDIIGYATHNGQKFLLTSGENNSPTIFATGSLRETRFALGFTISSNYYLLGDATTMEPSKAGAYEFSHRGDNVYDQPVFTYMVVTSKENSTWLIASKENVANNNLTGVYGVEKEGDTAMEGALTDANAHAGIIAKPGKYRFTINMMEHTYLIEEVNRPDYLETPNQANGWNPAASQKLQWKEPDGPFYGFANIDFIYGFKFAYKGNDGNETWLGATDGVLDPAGGNIMEGANMRTGLYWLTVNWDDQTFALPQYVDYISIIGLNGDWSNDIDLKPSADNLVWTADITATGATDFKFRVNHDWAADLGGSPEELAWGGSNIPVKAGSYNLRLDLSAIPYTFTLTAR